MQAFQHAVKPVTVGSAGLQAIVNVLLDILEVSAKLVSLIFNDSGRYKPKLWPFSVAKLSL